MKKRILALLLAVCVACSMLILPASASGSNTAVQTAVTLGGLTSDQTTNLAAPLTRGALTKLMVRSPPTGKAPRPRAPRVPSFRM